MNSLADTLSSILIFGARFRTVSGGESPERRLQEWRYVHGVLDVNAGEGKGRLKGEIEGREG